MGQVLLDNGHSVFQISERYPKTALQVAAKWGKRNICEFLIAKGLDSHEKNVMTSDGSNRRISSDDAVEFARSKGHHDLAEWLKKQPSPSSTNAQIASGGYAGHGAAPLA